MPRLNTPKKLDWIHSAIQEAQKGNLDQLETALDMVEAIRRRYFHAALKAHTFGALQASEQVLSLIDLRRNSGEGTLGINAEVATIIDQETGSHRKTMALDAICNDAGAWLKRDLSMGADEFVGCLRNTADKALRGETPPATPPAPELLDAIKQIARSAKYDQADGLKELEQRLETIQRDATAAVEKMEVS